jgi:NAD(P)-dependent dehydrogenase (short-subunit alcohol dehydrogenase family)
MRLDWFSDKTALVTGAAHGIGRGTAELLAELGARVIALDADETELHAVFAGTDRVTHFCGDVAGDGAAIGRALDDAHGPIDLLVNNVGIDTERGFMDLPETEFDLVFRTNLRGPWFLTRALTAAMIARERPGAVVFVSSLHDTFIRGFPHYSASKAAVSMLVRELAQELGPHGIRVNSVSPGVIHTARVPAPQTTQEAERLRRLVPLGHIGEPADVARVIVVLLSDWCSYVNGANVRVDGGMGVHSWSFDP